MTTLHIAQDNTAFSFETLGTLVFEGYKVQFKTES